MNKINFVGIQTFSDSDIVDKNLLSEIRKSNPKTIVKKYIVAHEGETNSKVVGSGSAKFKWSRNIIQSITDKIKNGIQCIKGHTQDNIHRGEKALGQIVGKGQEIIKGVLSTVVAVAFPDPSDSDYDSISMEADVEFLPDQSISSVSDIFRFALGRTKDGQYPAFSNALEAGTIQCFSNIEQNQKENKIMTFAELKQAIREMNVYPTQLWTTEELIGKPSKDDKGNVIFVGGVDDRIVSYLSKNIPDNTKTLSELEALKSEKEKLAKEKSELEGFRKQVITKELSSKVLDVAKERKLNEKLVKFIEKNLDKFSADGENNDKAVSEFIESQSKDFQKYSEIFGEPGIPSTATRPIGEPSAQGQNSIFDKML